MGFKKAFPLIKLSFHCFAKVIEHYQILPIGSALGFNCGPKIIAKKHFPLAQLSEKRVALPGKETTAHLLLNRLQLAPKEKVFCLYHEIATLVETGEVDCGLIIHESRFTFQQKGFVEIADLGELWHTQTEAPLPLGGLAIARHTPDLIKQQVVSILRESLKHARSNPKCGLPFILGKSQEKELSVVEQHIATYVNRETEELSPTGVGAIERLLGCDSSHDWLYSPRNV